MLVYPNAKINLGLSVIRKRSDGFHDLESIFIPVPWNDRLTIEKDDQLSLISSGITISDKIEENLSVRAYRLLQKEFQLPSVRIVLEKNIPIGAGLGGGSSDAAFTLKCLNSLFKLKLSTASLESYAERLGSDCAFFIQNKKAFVSGRGEVLDHTLSFELKTWCILVNPGIHISTKEAYGSIVPQEPFVPLKEAIKKERSSWQHDIINDFESALLPKYSALKELQQDLKKMGAYYVSMSGSGSSFFAFFEEEPKSILFDKSYSWKSFWLEV